MASQHITGRDVRNVKVATQQFGLRAFSGPRRAEQYDCRVLAGWLLVESESIKLWRYGGHESVRCAG